MIVVTDNTTESFHHLPDHQASVDLHGLTLRDSLKVLRTMDFGNIGGMHDISLSDKTYLLVDLTPASDGSYLMSSQRVTRWLWDNGTQRTMRRYKL